MSKTPESEENSAIKKAVTELKRLSADPEVRKLYEARVKQLEEAKSNGKGLGSYNEQVKQLLDEGVSVEILVKLTGRTKDEIEKIRDK